MLNLFKRLAVLIVAGVFFGLSSPHNTMAQDTTDGVIVPARAPDGDVIPDAEVPAAADNENEKLVKEALDKYPQGGPELVALISQMVVASPDLADAFLNARGSANPEQRAAIGAGLGRAVAVFNGRDTEADTNTATAIAQLVAAAGDEVIQTAFVAAIGDGTAAIAAAPATPAAPADAAGGRASGPRTGSLSVQSSGGGSGGGDPLSPSS